MLSDRALVLRFFGHGRDRLLIVNLGADLHFAPAPEPLLAPPRQQDWDLIFSSEAPQYGGSGIPRVQLDDGWHFPPKAPTVLASQPQTAES